jgi:hypothetical protein
MAKYITGAELLEHLKDMPEGTKLFVSYTAGRPPSPQALRESARNAQEGIAPRYFTGTLKSVWVTKRREPVLTMWVEERDSGPHLTPGAYRTFNPALGKLRILTVLEKVA